MSSSCALLMSLSPVLLWSWSVLTSNLFTVSVIIAIIIVTVLINWLLCCILCPGAELAYALASIETHPALRRMSLRLSLYRSITGRWRQGTRVVRALRRPLEPRSDLQSWSRRAILLLAALLALAVTFAALLTPVLLDALRGAESIPGAFCDRSPFTLDEELFACAPVGTPLPSWSTPEEPVELATRIDNILVFIWSGARSLVESVSLQLGSLLSSPAWSAVEALEQPGDPTEAWMLLPRTDLLQKAPTLLTTSLSTRGHDPFTHTLVSAVKAALTSGPHWRSACAGLAVDSRAAQVVCTGYTTWQYAVAGLQSAGPAAQLLPVLSVLCIFAGIFCIFDILADGRVEADARAEPTPTQKRRPSRPSAQPQPGRHTPGKMNRRKRRSRRPVETGNDASGCSPAEKVTEGTPEQGSEASAVNVSVDQVVTPVPQPPADQGTVGETPCETGECRPDSVQTDEGTVRGVACPDSTHRGIVSATCIFVNCMSGIATRLLSFTFFLTLTVPALICLAFCRILTLPFTVIHILACILWHVVVVLPLYVASVILWLSWLPLRGVGWLVLCVCSLCAAGVMNLWPRSEEASNCQPAGPTGSDSDAQKGGTQLPETEDQVSSACPDMHSASQQVPVGTCTCATCQFFALLNPAQHPDALNNCLDCALETESTDSDAVAYTNKPGKTNKPKTETDSPHPVHNCCHHNKPCAHAHTVAAATTTTEHNCADTASPIPRAIALDPEGSTRAAPGPTGIPSCQAETKYPVGLTPQDSSVATPVGPTGSLVTPAPVRASRLPCPPGLSDPAAYYELVDWLQDHVEPLFSEAASAETERTAEPQGGESEAARDQNFLFQPVVAPRRLRRFMRLMAECIERKCHTLRAFQHSICNALIVCTILCLVTLLSVCLGFSVSPHVSFVLAACEGLAVASFVVLTLELRRVRRPLVLMAKGNLADKLPQIRSWMGMALKEELDKYIAACVNHHQQIRPLAEEYYVAALLQAVGQKTPLHLTLTTTVTNDTINNDQPHLHFLRKAIASTKRWKTANPTGANADELTFIKNQIAKLELNWDPDFETQQDINYYQAIIDRKHTDARWAEVEFAEEQLALIMEEVAKPMREFYELETLDKLDWLLDHPVYRAEGERIDRRATDRRKRMQQDERERIPEFETLQFCVVGDMKVMIELRDYLLKVTGAITEVHVQAWRNRRMSAGENPLEVYAKIKDEALCIEAAGVLNFQADRELYALVTRKHKVGGAFFGNLLWDKVQTRVDQAKESRGWILSSPDMYMEIANLWATKAHEIWTDVTSTDPDLYAKIWSEINGRGKPPVWATTDRAAVPTGAVKSQDQPSGSGTGKGQTQAQNQNQGQGQGQAGGKANGRQKYYCEHCKKYGHSTDRCNVLRDLGFQAVGQQLALPAPPVVTTVTPGAPMDARAAAWKPNSSLYNQTASGGQQQRGQQGQQQGQQERPKGSVRRCETCTRINNNKEVQHFIRTECALADTSRPPPEWLNTPVPAVRAEIQRRRRAAGMSDLPPFVPKEQRPKKVGFAAPMMASDPFQNHDYNPGGRLLMMMERQPATQEMIRHSHNTNPEELLSFNPQTRTFTCKACDEECAAPIIAHNRPTHVYCRKCEKVHYSAAQLPDKWMHTSIWDISQTAAPDTSLALVDYSRDRDPRAFGSSIAAASSFTYSDQQLGSLSSGLPPIKTKPPGAPAKPTKSAMAPKMARLFASVARGKLGALTEYERILELLPANEQAEHLAQCRKCDIPLRRLANPVPASESKPEERPVRQRQQSLGSTLPRATTPARSLPNRFVAPDIAPSLAHLMRKAEGALDGARTSAQAGQASSSAEPARQRPTASTQPPLSRAEQLQADGWELAPIPGDTPRDTEELTTNRLQEQEPDNSTVAATSPTTRGDEDPYMVGDATLDADARQASGEDTAAASDPAPPADTVIPVLRQRRGFGDVLGADEAPIDPL
jgi:hypothetical protein